MLSTIAGSLDRAKDFVAAENRQLSSQPLKKIASGATLILAPSSCKCPSLKNLFRNSSDIYNFPILISRQY